MHVHDILYNIIMRCKADELGKLKLGFGGKQHDELFISPRRMREGYGSRSVCVSVITPAATYLQLVYTMQTRRHYRLQGVNCVENASFKSSGDICWPPWPSSLLDELSIDERESDGLIYLKISSV